MPQKPRTPMPVADRAKQFAPFAAIGGLDAALERKRRELCLCLRRTLSEEEEASINEKLQQLKKGSRVAVSHYVCGEYRQSFGTLLQINPADRSLLLEEEVITFENIGGLELLPPEGEGPGQAQEVPAQGLYRGC